MDCWRVKPSLGYIIRSCFKNVQTGCAVVAHAFNPSTREAKAGGFLSLRPAWSTKWVPGQPGLHRETLSRKTKKQTTKTKQNKTKKPKSMKNNSKTKMPKQKVHKRWSLFCVVIGPVQECGWYTQWHSEIWLLYPSCQLEIATWWGVGFVSSHSPSQPSTCLTLSLGKSCHKYWGFQND
jgi:hypothetical protein